MTLKALLIPDNLTDSDSESIDGGTGCTFISKGEYMVRAKFGFRTD